MNKLNELSIGQNASAFMAQVDEKLSYRVTEHIQGFGLQAIYLQSSKEESKEKGKVSNES